MPVVDFAWLIPIFPLGAFAIITLGGYRNHKFSHSIAIVGMLLSFVLSQVVIWTILSQGQALDNGLSSIPWMTLGSSELKLGVLIGRQVCADVVCCPICVPDYIHLQYWVYGKRCAIQPFFCLRFTICICHAGIGYQR